MNSPRLRAEHRLDTLRVTIAQLEACALDAEGRHLLARLRREAKALTPIVLARNPQWRSRLQRCRRWAKQATGA